MSYSVFYTPYAKETLSITYHFINNKFGLKAADSFLAKADQIISIIASNPFIYKASTFNEKVRIAFITKQCSLFYQVTETQINLLFFWDNRQEPILP